MNKPVHPIEARSYEIMQAELGTVLGAWAEPERSVVARMVHATADASFATTARIGPAALPSALAALRAGTVIICDSRMVAAGVPAVAAEREVLCYLDRAPAGSPGGPAPAGGPAPGEQTRAAMAVEAAALDHPHGCLWVIGNAPTALERLLELHRRGRVQPAAVIGLPVGYVGAAEAKEALWASPLAGVSITNRGRRGGSPVAAAALNALWRLAGEPRPGPPSGPPPAPPQGP